MRRTLAVYVTLILTLLTVTGPSAEASVRSVVPPVSLVFSRGQPDEVVTERLWLMSGPRHRRTPLPTARRSGDTEPSWSPGGRRIAFTRTVRESEDNWPASLWVFRANGPGAHLVAPQEGVWVAHLEPDWSPDGTRIAYRGVLPSPAVSTVVKTVRPDGSEVTQLIAPGGAPDWSPDGSALAFVRWSSDDITWGGPREIFCASADGTGIRDLSNDPADDSDPVWSPDGTQIAVVSDRSGNPDVWIMQADGTEPKQITHNRAPDQDPTWSPNGRWLAFTSSRVAADPFSYNAFTDIFVIDSHGENLQRITSGRAIERDPDWRPAGIREKSTRARRGLASVGYP